MSSENCITEPYRRCGSLRRAISTMWSTPAGSDCGLRIADCGLRVKTRIRALNREIKGHRLLESAIRNPQSAIESLGFSGSFSQTMRMISDGGRFLVRYG